MRGGHAAGGKEHGPHPAARTQVFGGDLQRLCHDPADHDRDQNLIVQKRGEDVHSESSSKSTSDSPASFCTLSCAASSSTLQRAANACPRSNSFIDSSSGFCSSSS